MSEWIDLAVGDGTSMRAYVARPAEPPRRGLLVFQEAFGVNAHIRDVTTRIAAEGYVALAPDYHHRAWEPGTQRDYNDENMKRGMELIPKLTADGILADVDACIAFLKTRKEANAAKLGAIGFCIGGHVTYLAAATRPIAAAAVFYGGGIATFAPGGGPKTVERTAGIKGKIVCFFGKDDPMISQDNVATIKRALEENKVRHEVVVYEGTSHAFFRDCDKRSYREPAAKDAWERTKLLFKEELG